MVAPIVPAPGHLRAILINNGASKTNNAHVDLILSAENATEMIISNESDFSGATWQPYCSAVEFDLKDEKIGPGYGDGTKTVYVKFRSADLTESNVFTASIVLDTTTPRVGPIPVIINDGSSTTDSRQVTLHLNATDAQWIEILNEDEQQYFQGTQMPYSETVAWTLSEHNGQKEVFVRFIDDIGNTTPFYSATVLLIGQSIQGTLRITEPIDGTYTTDKFINIKGIADFDSQVDLDIEDT